MLPPTLIQSRSGVSACSAGVHAGALVIVTAFFACPFWPCGVASAAGASAINTAPVNPSRIKQRPNRMDNPPGLEIGIEIGRDYPTFEWSSASGIAAGERPGGLREGRRPGA